MARTNAHSAFISERQRAGPPPTPQPQWTQAPRAGLSRMRRRNGQADSEEGPECWADALGMFDVPDVPGRAFNWRGQLVRMFEQYWQAVSIVTLNPRHCAGPQLLAGEDG